MEMVMGAIEVIEGFRFMVRLWVKGLGEMVMLNDEL